MLTEVLTVKEVADYLKLDKRTVYKLAKEGKIPSSKIGRQWRFSKSKIVDLVHPEVNAVRLH